MWLFIRAVISVKPYYLKGFLLSQTHRPPIISNYPIFQIATILYIIYCASSISNTIKGMQIIGNGSLFIKNT